jgi:CPA1 family monovalent cation:H+ antiporter
LIYALAINLALLALRFLWVWVSLRVSQFTQQWRGTRTSATSGTNWRLIAATSVAGVRGAITLAGVLTFPLAYSDGTTLPGRDLAIFLAMSVILFSLIVASVALPLLLRGLVLPNEPSHSAAENRARVTAAQAAIAAISDAQQTLSAATPDDAEACAAAAALLITQHQTSIHSRSKLGSAALLARHGEVIESRLRIAAIKAERVAIYRMLRARQIGNESAAKLVRELDLLEVRFQIEE